MPQELPRGVNLGEEVAAGYAAPDALCPLDLDQWEFYVLSTNRLNNLVGEQKTITLTSLLKLSPSKASFADLRDCVEVAAKEPPNAK
jgi:hypothetical protein